MKKLTAVFIVLIIAVSLSGCILKSGDDLLSLPKPPSDYLALQKNLDKIGQSGAGLTSPVSGKNQAPIQLVDLDGDGEAEAISLFRLSDSSGQFRVYVHKKEGGSYSEVGYIEGHGDSIESISYPRSDSSGGRSILVSWRLGASELGMTVYSYENGRLRAMLDSEYSNLLIDDIDQDGTDEIVTVVKEAKTNRFAAKLYLFQNDTLKMASETPLSKEAAAIDRIVTGGLSDGSRAVFIDSRLSGKGLVSDILVKKGQDLYNLSMSDATGSGEETVRKLSVNCTDVDSDRIIEIPVPELLPGYKNPDLPDAQWSLLWNKYSSDGSYKSLFRTYHNFAEEWYLIMKDGWAGKITVSKSNSPSVRYTTFSIYIKGGKSVPILKIYTFTGDDRNAQAKSVGFIYLGSGATASYAAVIPKEASGQELSVTESELEKLFRIIPEEWDSDTY